MDFWIWIIAVVIAVVASNFLGFYLGFRVAESLYIKTKNQLIDKIQKLQERN